MKTDTIAAVATAAGKGGIGIVRLSGPQALQIAEQITHKNLKPRQASYTNFYATIDNKRTDSATNFDNKDNLKVDDGIALFFPAPNSFTGEDVVELQAHGSKILLDIILKESVRLGARLARPGEFSERAFLNDKIDLVQAEAIADIIESNSVTAAIAARRSLNGDFSNTINALVAATIELRKYIEAAIDFPDEEIDYIDDRHIKESLTDLSAQLSSIFTKAKSGAVLREGLSAIIIGEPNSGKSSLLNCLAKDDVAIVSDREGTTRDLLKEDIHIDDITIRFIDTAGLRQSQDDIEVEGISRITQQIDKVNIILWMRDLSKPSTKLEPSLQEFNQLLRAHNITLPAEAAIIAINNKIDARQLSPNISVIDNVHTVSLSAKHQQGIDMLKQCLLTLTGASQAIEGVFSARRRHLDILHQTQSVLEHVEQGFHQQLGLELLAEDLKQIQNLLGEITGTFTSDQLLGKIFSSFCIGK